MALRGIFSRGRRLEAAVKVCQPIQEFCHGSDKRFCTTGLRDVDCGSGNAFSGMDALVAGPATAKLRVFQEWDKAQR